MTQARRLRLSVIQRTYQDLASVFWKLSLMVTEVAKYLTPALITVVKPKSGLETRKSRVGVFRQEVAHSRKNTSRTRTAPTLPI